jgi:hypothetical protein
VGGSERSRSRLFSTDFSQSNSKPPKDFMKRKVRRAARVKSARRTSNKLQLAICWGGYIEWIVKLEKLLRDKPRTVRIEIVGSGEVSADTALMIREALLKRSPQTRVIMNARSSLQNGAAMIWLLGDTRTIRDDAKIFFRRADLSDDAEVDPNADWKAYEPKYRDSYSEIDPDEGDHARVLQVINEFLPVKEFAGRLIGVAVLKQFGLVENDRVDGFLSNAFAKGCKDANTAMR